MGIDTAKQPNGAGKPQQAATTSPQVSPQPQTVIPKAASSADRYDSKEERQRRAEERSEYWIIFGHLTKITDFWLALFTLGLIGVGAWQGRHLSRTVSSFVAGERPYIFPTAPDPGGLFPPPHDRRYYSSIPEERWHKPFVTLQFGNFGRTVGMIRVVRIELIIGALPKKPVFTDAEEIEGQIIARPDQQTDPMDFGRIKGISPQELESIQKGDIHAHVFGYIKYTDFFGNLHEKGFGFRLHVTGPHQGAQVVGGNAFNYAKTKKAPEKYAD
jgi:hypothetical protein